ncbi:MAG: ABC transporter ATP-binding protein [Bacteroidota bacterium]|jgi:lipoprotein-releasing system ATP-binding protein|uniref:ABC transporter ATP-binding protein n=1 Tax=Candidatus Pollutiaquabacter sp. TaxID=3416354 RepID=UPI001B53B827|nr:ABC transporter ATP-binding protein [Bacteroidota bacterium]MBP6010086.1 ABC transporter ATP-binding protein [Bacteroidia bacterium]MBP7437608.1 ABC transporter ATP-binding protein [Bacteroidia bacterium]MBP7773354.1 ABC transporter ATP-binding protein [Bacteroidia bacterium]HRI41010.1 ABC transporter ATP-binding protein [Bacteroidia bacterium]
MISAKGITKRFEQLEILKGIDLEVARGEVVSIVGASGAGKSTLLHILGTLDVPDAGTLTIAGEEVSRLKSARLSAFRNRHLGFVFQSHHLLGEFSALENILVPALIAGESRTAAEKRAQELLAQLGLADRAEHRPSEMSGGEQQRVAVARALMNRPDAILADEPSGNLDSASARSLHELFFQLRRDLQQTFIIVTHNEELANMADRKLHMRDGLLH